MQNADKLGLSGSVAKAFLTNEITLLLALLGFLLGVFAVMVTPREEEPQINVTFANVFIPFPGASASEVAELVATPAGQVLSEIEGIKHIYATSRPGMAILTVEFKVGENATDAIVRLYNKVFSNEDWLPGNLGVGRPIIKPQGIDDVPIVTLTLWSKNPDLAEFELLQVAHSLETELKRVKGTRDIYSIGGAQRLVQIILDPLKVNAYGLHLNDLSQALQAANIARHDAKVFESNQEIFLELGELITSVDEVSQLVIGMYNQAPVYLSDVAQVRTGAGAPETYVWLGTGPQAYKKGIDAQGEYPAVTIAIGKKAGTNAVGIAKELITRIQQAQGLIIPDDVNVTITRNYGESAEYKANKLITKLFFATGVVVLLVWLALGWREAIIVGIAIGVTLALTLFASWVWGFTLNRVSLFALIFSIGILVDDAIVVVENIHRHMQMGKQKLLEAIPVAVNEIGGPTILATFAVIAALLPMAFVSGLMGPYMSPIPLNASTGMLISLIVAFVITPWLTYKFLAPVEHKMHGHGAGHGGHSGLYPLFNIVFMPFLSPRFGGFMRVLLVLFMIGLVVASASLAYFQQVILKMLPFDNKSEIQIIIDMPEGSSLEHTAATTRALAAYLAKVPEVSDYQAYVGTAAPINFNGLVRQYYLREGSYMADIQLNLVDKHYRKRESHAIALSLREPLQAIGKNFDANVKIVEIPPGPPVMSPLVAEIYGLDYQGQIAVAKQLEATFRGHPDVVDIDTSVEYPAKRLILSVDRQKAALYGLSQAEIVDFLTTLLAGRDIGYLHGADMKYAVPLRLELAASEKGDLEQLLLSKIRNRQGQGVVLHDVVSIQETTLENSIYHKDLLPVVYVLADAAGQTDSPLYSMFGVVSELDKTGMANGQKIQQYFVQPPDNPYEYSVKWDGEWQVTYETFRDMGIAYSVGLLLIYFLVVAQFKSYVVPLVIMAPIPLTLIGVMPGHALLDAQFTATSMIGMIALAGIIVRNSILLVDFINEQLREGMALAEAVINSAAVRAQPIMLTALSAMLGALFILDDPIFKGLAISLIFGIFVSTILTLVVIPLMYFGLLAGEKKAPAQA